MPVTPILEIFSDRSMHYLVKHIKSHSVIKNQTRKALAVYLIILRYTAVGYFRCDTSFDLIRGIHQTTCTAVTIIYTPTHN